jgi:hypothetical protein
MTTYIEPTTATSIFVSDGRGEKCQGCGVQLFAGTRAIHVVPPANPRISGNALNFGNRSFHSRQCFVTFCVSRNEPVCDTIAAWAKGVVPEIL